MELLVAAIWVAAIVAVVPLHFYKAWQKLDAIPNKREYILWVGFETVFAAGLVGTFGYTMLGR